MERYFPQNLSTSSCGSSVSVDPDKMSSTGWDFYRSFRSAYPLLCGSGISQFFMNAETNQMTVNWTTRSYFVAGIIAKFLALAFTIFYLPAYDQLVEIVPPSYIWTSLASIEVIATNVTFVLLMIICDSNRMKQIQFLRKIFEIDSLLAREFNMTVDHKYVYIMNYAAATFIISFHVGIVALVSFFSIIYGRISLIPLFIIYQLAQMVASTASMYYSVFTLAIKFRFELLKRIFRKLLDDHRSVGYTTEFYRKLILVIETFKEVSRLIETINDLCGKAAFLRAGHELSLLLSQMYFLFEILQDDDIENRLHYLSAMIIWMVPNSLKLFSVILTISSTSTEVSLTNDFDDFTERKSFPGKQMSTNSAIARLSMRRAGSKADRNHRAIRFLVASQQSEIHSKPFFPN